MTKIFDLTEGKYIDIDEVSGEEPKKSKRSLFDFVNMITNDINRHQLDDNDLDQYNIFMINKALSMGMDTLFYANEMNIHSNLPKDLHYTYLHNVIRKGKRYNKWPKGQKVNNLEEVCLYYGVNESVGLEYLKLLNEDELNYIISELDAVSNNVKCV